MNSVRANVGPRDAVPIPSSGKTADESKHSSVIAPLTASNHHIKIADSELVVVKAFLEGSQITAELDRIGLSSRLVTTRWSDDILSGVPKGNFDFAVVNASRYEAYKDEHPGHNLRVLGDVCHAMGGRNVSLVMQEAHPLAKGSDGLLSALNGRKLYVGMGTDRYRALRYAAGLEHDDWIRYGVEVINVPEPSYEVFETDPTAVIVGGQNARFEALMREGVTEVVLNDIAPQKMHRRLNTYARNILVASPRALKQLDHENEFFSKLFSNFWSTGADPKRLEALVDLLIDTCGFDDIDVSSRKRVTQHIIYETYRFGAPAW